MTGKQIAKHFSHFCHNQNGGWHVWQRGQCEKCGRHVEEANAVNLHDITASELISLGLLRAKQPDMEEGYCEDLDMAVCLDCYQNAKKLSSPENKTK